MRMIPLLLIAVALVPVRSRQPEAPVDAVLYEGARLISGTEWPRIESSAFLVEGAHITRVARKGEIAVPRGGRRVDLAGKTVMPALINVHAHPGFQKGLTYTRENYTRDTYLADLERAADFGVRAVVSQGIDAGDVAFDIRREQRAGKLAGTLVFTAGRGIGAPNAGPGADAFKGIAYEVTTEDETRQAVREQAARQVDLIKIWVDDRGGRAPRLAPALYRAAIDEAHARGLTINAHVFYHSDAEDLVAAGVDALAHLVRDREMSDSLIAEIVRRNLYVMPNLGSAERATHDAAPPWFTEPHLLALLRESVPAPVIARMQASFAARDPAAVRAARERYGILQRSLAKLSAAGARIVLGSDTGLVDHFFGYAEQRELEAMVGAGMTPAQVITAATSRPAEFLKLKDRGSLAPGKKADFIVLDANPLADIRNTRRIAGVFFDGAEVRRHRSASTR
jgi:imidazolonepropionase-like amidohydrolase